MSENNLLITQELIDRCSAYVYDIISKKPEKPDELAPLLKDPIWRIGNLYWCIDGDSGSVVRFKPKPAQCVLLYWIYVLKRNRFVILKARQLGFSTLIAIIGLDQTITNKDTTFNICSHTEDSAKDLLREKVKFNLERLPRGLRQQLDMANSNQNELVFADNWKIRSKVKVRSGTSQVLHISEWGKVAAIDKIRSEEIRTGTLPTAKAKNSLVFVESTYEGPAAGDFYDMIQMSMQTTEETAQPDSYWYMFFPWYYEKGYRTECQESWIEERTRNYFENLTLELEESGNPYTFSKEQMYFWQVKSYEYGPKMQREMPSTAKEAMTAPVDGAFYADRLLELERKGRVCEFEWNRNRPIFAVCDVGVSDPFSVWLIQTDGRDIDIIYSYEDKDKSTAHGIFNTIRSLGFNVSRWILPWDAQPDGASFGWISDFKRAGAVDIQRLKKYNNSIRMQIDHMLTVFPRLRFRKSATVDGRTAIAAYHWEEASPGQLKPKPEHDWSSHYGSSFGYIGEAEKCGFFRIGARIDADYYRDKSKPAKKFELKRC